MLLCVLYINTNSQIISEIYTKRFNYEIKGVIPEILIEEQDNKSLLEYENDLKNGISPMQFATTINVNYNFKEISKKIILDNNDKVWIASFKSEDAFSLNIIFSKFIIPKGSHINFYNEDKSDLYGPYTFKDQLESGKFPTPIVRGEKIIVEYFEPAFVNSECELQISKINHGYKDISSIFNKSSGACNVNINCTDGSDWQTIKKSVCRIVMGGTNLCTGTLINNVLLDGTPYLLTANHCTGQPYDEWVFYFNYESSSCSGTTGPTNQTVSGCQLVATTTKLDFCLVKLSVKPQQAYSPYYAGWDLSTTLATNTTCIHHPSGDIKKISKDNNSPSVANYGSGYDYNSHWLISSWEVGTTEGGSSGSALFNQHKRIIGDLTGGQANCANSVNDYYNRFDLAWNKYTQNNQQLKYWLDPNNSGVTFLNGFDPYSSGPSSNCDTLSNIGATENMSAYNFTTMWGYWTGHNEYMFKKFADRFYSSSSIYISSIEIPAFKAYYVNSSSYISLKIWSNSNGKPGQELLSQNVNINQFNPGYWKLINLTNPIQVVDTFFIGYEIYYNNPVDTFAVYQAESRPSGGLSSAFVYYNNNWSKYSDLSTNFNTSLGLRANYCTSNSINELELMKKVNVFPNPANNKFSIMLENNNIDKIEIYNLLGEIIEIYEISDVEYNIENIKNGIYIMKIYLSGQIISKRLIISR